VKEQNSESEKVVQQNLGKGFLRKVFLYKKKKNCQHNNPNKLTTKIGKSTMLLV
jgi:hypothetical protein